jgi:hypothetical protein
MEGKAKGRVGLEGMEGREWEGKKDQGEGKEGRGGRGKGRRKVKAIAPKTKILATPLFTAIS